MSSAKKLPKSLMAAKDARQLFGYFLKRAALSPGPAMRPEKGPVKRVVLFTEDFDDRFVDRLARAPNLRELTQELQELRLVCTLVTLAGVSRLKELLPNVQVNLVPVSDWEKNVDTGNPEYNLETREYDMRTTRDDSKVEMLQHDLEKRYGHLGISVPKLR